MTESSPPVFRQIPHKSLREVALSAIRQAIIHGDIKPGQRLLETEIAAQLGISRAPVREALRQLEMEGLVVSEPHRGTFVIELSDDDLWEIYTLRAAIESLAVQLVTERADEDTLTRLQEAVDAMQAAARVKNIPRLAALDMSFHEMLCRASGHSRLLDVWMSMNVQIRTFIDLTSTLYLPAEDVARLHAEVLAHIRSGKADEAGAVLRQHILDVGQSICQLWRNDYDP